jgi:ABC-type Fe3+-hydroxamate transport system substrate-binding protein
LSRRRRKSSGAALRRRLRVPGLLEVLAIAGLLLGCREGAHGGARPRETTTRASSRPSRVVALAPNLTEIVFALGAGESLVGVSEYSDFPEEARRIPRVGGLEVDAERVAALRPDLVLAMAEGSGRSAVASLEAAGVPVVVVPSGSLEAVLSGIRLVGARLGRSEEAERLTARLAKRRSELSKRIAGRKRPRTLLLVWPDPPQAAGGGTFLDDLLREAGADNLVGDRSGWPVLSPEYVATVPVELLVIPDSEQTRGAYARAFATGALSRGPITRARVVRLDESALTRPGPRVFDMLERLAESLS